MTTRIIRSREERSKVTDLLQTLFISALIEPSPCIWLVSPWITDIPILDNRADSFSDFNPDWPRSYVRLSQVLVQLTEFGTTVHVATRPDSLNAPFLEQLNAHRVGGVKRLCTHSVEELHEKGILAQRYYLAGSMNLTMNGIELLEEVVRLETSNEVLAVLRIQFTARWGGVIS